MLTEQRRDDPVLTAEICPDMIARDKFDFDMVGHYAARRVLASDL
jgi:hypothetical protein